ncbi:hypothetical protein BU15DRAFT_65763 [Melanogaster broomeanus]|nr:hypothetical protein BU15DRAFT_65763 [Melanogaster broomeanus]
MLSKVWCLKSLYQRRMSLPAPESVKSSRRRLLAEMTATEERGKTSRSSLNSRSLSLVPYLTQGPFEQPSLLIQKHNFHRFQLLRQFACSDIFIDVQNLTVVALCETSTSTIGLGDQGQMERNIIDQGGKTNTELDAIPQRYKKNQKRTCDPDPIDTCRLNSLALQYGSPAVQHHAARRETVLCGRASSSSSSRTALPILMTANLAGWEG